MTNGRPSDEDIVAFENSIMAEISSVPLIGPFNKGFNVLQQLYADNESPYFLAQFIQLESEYSFTGWRNVKGDGNCFYRSFLFSFFENFLIETARSASSSSIASTNTPTVVTSAPSLIPPAPISLLNQFQNRIKSDWRSLLKSAGYDLSLIEEFEEVLLNFVQQYETRLSSFMDVKESFFSTSLSNWLLTYWNNQDYTNYILVYFKYLLSAYLRSHDKEFEPFLTHHPDILTFTRSVVEPFGKEAEDLCIVALVRLLCSPLTIVSLDATHPKLHCIDFNTSDAELTSITTNMNEANYLRPSSRVYLLFLPGHYDILYK